MGDSESIESLSRRIKSENADRIGVPTEELERMSIREVEEQFDISVGEPKTPRDDRGGYFVRAFSSIYRILTEEELSERRTRVYRFLGIADE